MFAELIEWALALDPEFAFLLALPFVVALAGFLAETKERTAKRDASSRSRSAHRAHVSAWSRGM
jgi:hypothetical protein